MTEKRDNYPRIFLTAFSLSLLIIWLLSSITIIAYVAEVQPLAGFLLAKIFLFLKSSSRFGNVAPVHFGLPRMFLPQITSHLIINHRLTFLTAILKKV